MANVLIVDDASFMRKKMSSVLTELGHTIVGEAENGEQAVDMYNEKKPQAVFMDITMPVLSGKDALIRIKHEHNDAKVIMCSELGSEVMIADCSKFVAKAYIVKPYTKEQISEILDKVLAA